MCFYCAVEYVTGIDTSVDEVPDVINWPPFTPEMREAAQLVADLYELPKGCTGGPLHIFTDDYNADDSNLATCRRQATPDECPDDWYGEAWPAIRAISLRILDLMEPMTPAQRVTALVVAHGEVSPGEVGL